MRECFDKQAHGNAEISLCLTFAQRSKSRGKAPGSDGEEVAWFLDRGHVMADGERLIAKDGTPIKIIAASEAVSEVHAAGPALARAAYHLGNRHLAVQIGTDWIRYQTDHVIDDMIHSLGLQAKHASEPFHPESGAYKGGHHHHE